MKILFLCTAFNSLSQRLALELRSRGHLVTIELALSPALMLSAFALSKPDLVLCPFLTKRVPAEIYTSTLTLIIHPGAPGDAGPSAIDFALFGDTGEMEVMEEQMWVIEGRQKSQCAKRRMRSHWAVTCLQAIEEFDAGPIWGFDQFALDEETSKMSKSELYRGPVTTAALNACLVALERITIASTTGDNSSSSAISVDTPAPAEAREECASQGLPFLGGQARDRPLLKASIRDFVPLVKALSCSGQKIPAEVILQRIQSGDSQPGVLSALLGAPLFLYDAHVERGVLPADVQARHQGADKNGAPLGTILAMRDEALLVECGADYPIWIGHARRPKAKNEKYLHPKLPALLCVSAVQSLQEKLVGVPEWPIGGTTGEEEGWAWRKREGTYQQIWAEMEVLDDGRKIAFVHFEFYNGATSTSQSLRLRSAISWALAQESISALVLMGGQGYFSNGIALNVIEGAQDPALESWRNINAIDDVVQAVLCPPGVLTFAALRGNAAAGGLAVADACDVVLSSEHAVLNPHYRGLGLYGSEYHTFSWTHRSGEARMKQFSRDMLPMSVEQAREAGLVDHVIRHSHSKPSSLTQQIKECVVKIMTATSADAAVGADSVLTCGAKWTKSSELESEQSLLSARMLNNKYQYLSKLFDEPASDPTAFMKHFETFREEELQQMVLDFWHPHRSKRYHSRRVAFVRKLVPQATPTRFAIHRRFESAWGQDQVGEVILDEEEMDEFDGLAGIETVLEVPAWPETSTLMKPETCSMSRAESDRTIVAPVEVKMVNSIAIATSLALEAEVEKITLRDALVDEPLLGGVPTLSAISTPKMPSTPRLVSFEDDGARPSGHKSSASMNQARAAAARGSVPASPVADENVKKGRRASINMSMLSNVTKRMLSNGSLPEEGSELRRTPSVPSLTKPKSVAESGSKSKASKTTLPRILSFARRKKVQQALFTTPPLPSTKFDKVPSPRSPQLAFASSCYYSETGAECVKA